ncbi:hypothetical protein [Mucilaginibacter pedocola]|uniref:Uncharacterized protein n=1 Tax=Mucilaginibacter pedocola TaxID=1792845 RepID=A0A1S9P8A4_9SPHI|nr:hypothetical protein [Mucilaginibacter pedocola]OOQ57162.1 hypothetical protein BC343_16715 [Mucilaginibacter pedocola]
MNAQRTNHDLLMLLVSVRFDKSRIVIAEHELSENFLTLYLEDREDFKPHLEDTLLYKLPISCFEAIISNEGFNSYEGIKQSPSGRCYNGRIIINEPLLWWEQDATLYQQQEVLHLVLQNVLASAGQGQLAEVA